MNWYKKAQNILPNQAAGIIAAALYEAGMNPSKPVEDLTQRLGGQPPDSLEQALTQAMTQAQNFSPAGLNPTQMEVVKQVQQMMQGVEGNDFGMQQQSQPQQPTPVDGIPDLPQM